MRVTVRRMATNRKADCQPSVVPRRSSGIECSGENYRYVLPHVGDARQQGLSGRWSALEREAAKRYVDWHGSASVQSTASLLLPVPGLPAVALTGASAHLRQRRTAGRNKMHLFRESTHWLRVS